MLLFVFILAVVFVPTTVMLTIGMLPAIVASLVDRTKERTLGLTVGAMNLAGCVPFVIDLWTSQHSIDRSVEILSDPLTIVVMYMAAGVGYVIDWALTGIVAVFLTENGKARLESIDQRQKQLVARWGAEVSGDVSLGPDGFPVGASSASGEREENTKSGDK